MTIFTSILYGSNLLFSFIYFLCLSDLVGAGIRTKRCIIHRIPAIHPGQDQQNDCWSRFYSNSERWTGYDVVLTGDSRPTSTNSSASSTVEKLSTSSQQNRSRCRRRIRKAFPGGDHRETAQGIVSGVSWLVHAPTEAEEETDQRVSQNFGQLHLRRRSRGGNDSSGRDENGTSSAETRVQEKIVAGFEQQSFEFERTRPRAKRTARPREKSWTGVPNK